MSTTKLSNLITRTLTGVIFVAAIIGSILLSHKLFSVLFLCVSVLALYEFYTLLQKSNAAKAQLTSGIIAGSMVYIIIALISWQLIGYKFLCAALLIPPLIFIIELYRKSESPIQNIALTLLGILYISLPFALLNIFLNPQLIPGEYHPGILIGFFVIIWCNDSFAYLTGITFGRHRLFERISPKKSWEGSIGGFFFGLLAAYFLSLYFQEFDLTNWLIIAAIIMIFGTFGDLAESMIKRSLKIKDSGNILPGHGGLLDRFDAVIMAAPPVLIYINMIHQA